MAAASAVTPGPAALLTQAVILELWAYAEAENDLKILYDKKTVPLLKDDTNWALSIENVLGNGSLQTEESAEKEDAGGGDELYKPKVMRGRLFIVSVGASMRSQKTQDHEDNGYHTDKYEISVQRYLLAERI